MFGLHGDGLLFFDGVELLPHQAGPFLQFFGLLDQAFLPEFLGFSECPLDFGADLQALDFAFGFLMLQIQEEAFNQNNGHASPVLGIEKQKTYGKISLDGLPDATDKSPPAKIEKSPDIKDKDLLEETMEEKSKLRKIKPSSIDKDLHRK